MAPRSRFPGELSEALTSLNEPDALYEVISGRIVEKAVGVYGCWLAAVVLRIAPVHISRQTGSVVPPSR